MASQVLDGFTLDITRYASHAAEVLRMRNANRAIAQSCEYLDWRYNGLPGGREPEIFWLRDQDGRAVGMASLIYRPYWVNNLSREFAVLGDISLDTGLRGRGLGGRLLKFLSEYLEETHPDLPGFVIPNEAAQHALHSIGWSTPGRLVPHVLVLNPESRIRRKMPRLGFMAGVLAAPVRTAIRALTRVQRTQGYTLAIVHGPDGQFEDLWRRYDKSGVVLSDRSVATLAWRYFEHPHISFQFAKFTFGNSMVGYLVFTLSQQDRECVIYDLICLEAGKLGCLLALFVSRVADFPGIDSIRLVLADRHPYSNRLWKLGFIAREASGVFQIFGGKALAQPGGSTWLLTNGDKDI